MTRWASNKENVPPIAPNNQQQTWCYYFSCGAQTANPSDKLTSEWKLASHRNQATFKETMGVTGNSQVSSKGISCLLWQC